ncbi:MAG: asparagine synthase (glutamine-hydrolyzing) [Chthoniobacterales bacterium]
MCGIAGFVGNGNLQILEQMTRSLAHRGPDGEDYRQDPPVYLGHRRLAILDLEGGRQPMTTQDGRYAIVFNGEIYNHQDLRKQLEAKGHLFVTDHSDTETLLIGFAALGPAVLERLNGMWSFVVYDREEKKLFGSRDRFGKKPLYYWHRGTGFAFASELSALMHHPGSPKSVSQFSLQKYFAYGYIPAPQTVIGGIWKLPAGHWFSFDLENGDLAVHQYWDYRNEPDPANSDADAVAEALAEKLERAVQRRLIADVPLGVFLSGGIDSSSVAAFARRSLPELTTFTIGFEEPSFDESRSARQVAQALGTSHYSQTLSLEKSKELLPSIIDRLDEPMGDPSLLPTYLLCKFARQHVTVALAGDGGDELFCGYDPFKALRRAQLYSKLVPKPIHFCIRLLAGQLPVGHRNLSLDFKIKQTLKGLSFPSRLWLPVWMGPLGPQELTDLFRQSVNLEDLYAEAIQIWDSSPKLDLVSRTQQFFIKLYLQDCILTKVDRASMMNSLEARCPFLDIEVVDLVRRIPAGLKFRHGQTKWILKRAVKHILSRTVVSRPKKGFGVPVGKWFQDGSILQLSELHHACAWYRGEFFQRKLSEHRARKADHRLYLWNAWLLNQWLAR